jgi:hypothetical protein
MSLGRRVEVLRAGANGEHHGSWCERDEYGVEPPLPRTKDARDKHRVFDP